MVDIIDAHHHIWLQDRTPWLAGPMKDRIFGDYTSIRRDYLAAEFAKVAKSAGIIKSVYVQINVAPGDEIWEVEWAAKEGAKVDMVQATVSYANLMAPNLTDVLDAQMTLSPLRGVRQQMHWHEKPLYTFAKTPDMMMDAGFRRGMKEVEARGLHFELQVFQSQFKDTLDLVDAFPKTQFVLVHSGMPHSKEKEAIIEWRLGLVDFAQRPNVVTKISGAGTFSRSCSVKEWREIIIPAIEIFGPERSMFGSNFPVEKLWTDYATLVSVVKDCLTEFTQAEQKLILHDTAVSFYKI